MQILRKLERALRKRWKRLTGQQEIPRLYRAQVRFRRRYPDYEIGVGTYGMPVVHDWHEGSTLRIGCYCSIANNVQILLGGQHRTDWVSTFPFPAYLPQAAHISGYGGTRGDVEIGHDVWLCNDSIILSGVKIGHGAVVASGAVVTRDVEPYSVVAGNPARPIRWRFDEPQRQALLEIAWWDWPEQDIAAAVERLCSTDIADFIAFAQARQRSNSRHAALSTVQEPGE